MFDPVHKIVWRSTGHGIEVLVLDMMSYYRCCCIHEPVIFSHCVHLKLGHLIPCHVESLLWSRQYCPFNHFALVLKIHVCTLLCLSAVLFSVKNLKKYLASSENDRKCTALTLLWFYLSKPFKICLLAKWLSICLNLSKPSIIFCYCTTTPFKTLRKDLKGRKIGLWYVCSESCFTFQNLS